jgi:UDP-2-acetamido-3-amino-2,3-dideoxy-glucuronate N-acetyltransferase
VSSATSSSGFFAHPHALVESTDIGAGTRVWAFAHVMKGARIGAECNICDHSFVESNAVLGNNVTVKNGVAIWEGVTIEDDVFLGPNCVFTNDPNPRAYIKKTHEALVRTNLRRGVTIGANAVIVCGITIGKFAFVGAGAAVIRNVPDYALIVGNPGRQIGWMCYCATKLPLATSAAIDARCECGNCHRRYVRSQEGLKEL